MAVRVLRSVTHGRLCHPHGYGVCVTSSLAARRNFCDDKTPKWHARYPQKYFDFKAFREALREKKDMMSTAEMREIRREYAPPPPDGWTVMTFLEHMQFGEGADEVAELFETWEDFISMSRKDVKRLRSVTQEQRRRLNRHLRLFHHGLWPRLSPDEHYERFKGKPLENEGMPWTEAEDRRLLDLAEEYDVNFGDPWIYLSWDLQRREADVRDRYIELVVKPRERSSVCEIAVTKSSRPLLMNRKFRMIPPDLYIVPSEKNFQLAEAKFKLPAAFEEYRQSDIF
eukprot:TRINITY_DN11860_c2_g1_i1.p1 TRINITY_DN11860_c2_g1~~TRINITY_DN11860_c2_g1_i1.p1  ORF type:complete len:284 (+),score=60.12 TRINITY_DN11860_c2_g1_i1:70-921(+)